jgi:hypothetical protein
MERVRSRRGRTGGTGAAKTRAAGAGRRASVRLGLLALLTACMLAVGAASASAVIVQLQGGKVLSYQPLRHAAPRAFDEFFSNLDYNGGPVMSSNTDYAFYWAPAGSPPYPGDYQPGVNRYFEDLAHDSGTTANVESVSAQYNDAAGQFASYNSHFGGALIDTDPTRPTAANGRRSASPTRSCAPSSRSSSKPTACRGTSPTSTSCSPRRASKTASRPPGSNARPGRAPASTAPTTARSPRGRA